MQNGPATMNFQTALTLNTDTLKKESNYKDMQVTFPYGVSMMLEELVKNDKNNSDKIATILEHKDIVLVKLNKQFQSGSDVIKDYISTVESYFAILEEIKQNFVEIKDYLKPIYEIYEKGKLTEKTKNNDYNLSISELSLLANRGLFKHKEKLRSNFLGNLAMGTLIYQKLYALEGTARKPAAIDETKATPSEIKAHKTAEKKSASHQKEFDKFNKIIKDTYQLTSSDILANCFQIFGRAGDLLPTSFVRDMVKNVKVADSYQGDKAEAERRLEAFKVCAADLQYKLSEQPKAFNAKVIGKYQDAFNKNPLTALPQKAQVNSEFIVAYQTKMNEYEQERDQTKVNEEALATVTAPVVFSTAPKRELPVTPNAALAKALPAVSTTPVAQKPADFAAKQALVAGIFNRAKP